MRQADNQRCATCVLCTVPAQNPWYDASSCRESLLNQVMSQHGTGVQGGQEGIRQTVAGGGAEVSESRFSVGEAGWKRVAGRQATYTAAELR